MHVLYTCYGLGGSVRSRMTYWVLREDTLKDYSIPNPSPRDILHPFICKWDKDAFEVFDHLAPFGARFTKYSTFEEALVRLYELDKDHAHQRYEGSEAGKDGLDEGSLPE